MKKRIISIFLVCLMVLSLMPTAALADEPNVAKIGETEYNTMQAAFEACPTDGTQTTITLLDDVTEGASFGFADGTSGRNIVLDLGGHTYTFKDPGMGSTGTETQAMHLAHSNTLTVKNGTLAVNTESTSIKRMIQNYCDLTLEDVIVDTSSVPASFSNYNNSFCRSTVTLKGSTQFKASSDTAVIFDIDGSYCQNNCDVALVIDSGFTGSIGGKVEYVASTTEGHTATLTDSANYFKVVQSLDNSNKNYYGTDELAAANGVVAKIGTTGYATLADAVGAAQSGQTVTLLKDAEGSGVMLTAQDAKAITINLGENKYTFTDPAVGSTGTETQGFHFETGNTVTVKNGTLNAKSGNTNVKMLIQNYCDLTLDYVTVDGTNLNGAGTGRYVVSNNCGTVTIKDSHITAASGDFALDSCKYASYTPPTVTVTDSTVTGKVEVTGGTLNLTSGTITGDVKTWSGTANLNGGTITGLVGCYDAGTVTVDGTKITNTGTGANGIVVWGDGTYGQEGCKTPTLNVKSGEISGSNAAIITNGTDKSDAVINISGGTIKNENGVAIYAPSGVWTVSGGTITGTTAMYFKSEKLTISDGIFNGTGASAEYNYNGNGCNDTGDALVIDSCNYPNGLESGNISITGGTFTSTNAKAVAAYTSQGAAAVTGFIKGGSFSSQPDEKYLATGVSLTEKNGVYTAAPAASVTDGDISVNVSVTGATGTVTAAKISEADYANAAAAIMALDNVDGESGEPYISGVTANSSKVIAAGTVKINGGYSTSGETHLTVTFPNADNSNYDPETQQLVLKAYGTKDAYSQYSTIDAFIYYYPDSDAVTFNQDGTVTVNVTYDRVQDWILAATDKNVQQLNFRGYEYAKTVRTDESGNETISLYDFDYTQVEGTKVYYFALEYSFYYDKAAQTVTKSYLEDDDENKVYTTDANGIMGHCIDNEKGTFDLIGKLGGDWKKVTYGSNGYTTYLKVGQNNPTPVPDLSGNTEVGNTGLKVGVDCSIIGESGQVVKVTYTVQNVGSEAKTFSLGSGADVQIGSDDYAPIKALNLDSKHVGMSMSSRQHCDRDAKGDYASLAFICKNNAMVNDVDTLWYGIYYYYDDYMFNGQVKTDELTGIDSGMSYSWMNEELAIGETKTYTVLFGIGDVTQIITEVTEEQEKYEASLYTVHFDPNGGDAIADRKFARDNDYYLPGGTKAGSYVLVGWQLGETVYPLDKSVRNLAEAAGEITLKAIWKEPCMVTYVDTIGTAPESVKVEYGAKLTLPNASKENYTFCGWEYNGVVYPAGTQLSFAGYATATLNAVWKENTRTVTFDPNGGVCVRQSKTVGVTAATYGALPTPTHPYATFDGWYDAKDAGTKVEATTAAPNNNITLYAHWKNFKTFDVTVNGNKTENAATYGTNYTYNPGSGTYDVVITVGGKPYYATPDGDGKYTIPGDKVTGNIVITAKESAANNVTLTYMLDSAVVYTTSVAKTGNYPTVALPTKTGYTVDGWFVSNEANAEKASGIIGEGVTTLYAKATVKSIPVTFADGTPVNVNYGGTITFPTANPTKDGYKFLGWKGDNGVIIPKVDSPATYNYKMPDVESLNFTPLWQNVGSLTITVQDTSSQLVSGATVNLVRNGTVVKSAVTGADGTASFSGLDYGAYNVAVVSKINEEETVTTMVGKDITTGKAELTVTVPTFKLNTVVDSSAVEMNLTSENLDKATTETPAANQEVTITLKAAPSADTEKATIDNKVSEDAATNGTGVQMVDYVDLTVTKKTVTDDGNGNITGTATETLDTTSDYQIISIEITDSLYQKLAEVDGTLENILVYRLHGTQVTKFAKMSEADGKSANRECYWMKNVEGKDYVVIKAKNFSTYAIGYQDSEVETETIPTVIGGGSTATTYTITGDDTTNGKLTVSSKSAAAGKTITITVAPDDGYKLGTLTLKDAKGNAITVTKVNDTTYTFKMPAANVTVSATFVKAGTCPQDETCVYAKYTDANTKEWYHDGVHFCVENGYMVGVTADKFAPSGTLSRAMIVTMLWRIEGKPAANYAMSFKDVADGQWYTEAIRWAQSTGVVTGYNADSFEPNDNVTREQLAAILMRYAKYKGIDVSQRADLAKFADVKSISGWALENVKWANAVGIINGRTETTIAPTGNATRAEAASMVQRFCETILK